MKKQNKKIILTIIICIVNISLFASILATNSNTYYWDYSSTIPSSYELKDITVTNLYSANNNSTTTGTDNYKGYYIGQFTIDFSKSSAADNYIDTFEAYNKRLYLNLDKLFYYKTHGWIYRERIYISDTSDNDSTMSGFAKITKTDSDGSSSETIWYNMTNNSNLYLNDSNNFGNITTEIFTVEYYLIIDDIEDLDPYADWKVNIPDIVSSQYTTPTIRIKVLNVPWSNSDSIINTCRKNEFYYYNPVYTKTGAISVGNTQSTNDIYGLNVNIQKKFNDGNDSFFNGQIHDYYSLDFDSYKYGVLTEEPFSICLEISSAHNWYLYLDNEENPKNYEKIAYDLYLKYKSSSTYSSILIGNNQDKILIKNIKSSNASSIIYLQTKSDNAKPNYNTKGKYQDTVYLNFITDGWTNGDEDSFAEKTITLQ